MLNEFKEFALKGNVLDMAVGIVIGAAFGTIVQSMVNDLLMPPIGLALGDTDFSDLFIVLREGVAPAPYLTLEAASEVGAVTLNYGRFFNALLSFLIIALALFFVVRNFNQLKRREEAVPEPSAPAASQEIVLLTEIRDLLKTEAR